MSNNDLRAQYRSSEGRAKQGFASPVGEVDVQQLKEMVAGSGVEPYTTGTTIPCLTLLICCLPPYTQNQWTVVPPW
jgi:hypothetical protein